MLIVIEVEYRSLLAAVWSAVFGKPSRSCRDGLLQQWSQIEAEPRVKSAGELVLAHVDDDGFLATPLEQIATRAIASHELACSPEVLQEALDRLQKDLTPSGVVARDLREALLLQIDARVRLQEIGEGLRDEGWRHARTLIERCWDDLYEGRRTARLAEQSELAEHVVEIALGRLRRLSCAPGRALRETVRRESERQAVWGELRVKDAGKPFDDDFFIGTEGRLGRVAVLANEIPGWLKGTFRDTGKAAARPMYLFHSVMSLSYPCAQGGVNELILDHDLDEGNRRNERGVLDAVCEGLDIPGTILGIIWDNCDELDEWGSLLRDGDVSERIPLLVHVEPPSAHDPSV